MITNDAEYRERIQELLRSGLTPELIQNDGDLQQYVEFKRTYEDLKRFRLRQDATYHESRMRISGGGRELFVVSTDLLAAVDQAAIPAEALEIGMCSVDPEKLTDDSQLRIYLDALDNLHRVQRSFIRSLKRGKMYDLIQQLEILLPSLLGMIRVAITYRINGTTGRI